MKKNFLIYCLLLASILPFKGYAQDDDDFGVWISFNLKKDVKKWSFELEPEFRTMNGFDNVERFSSTLRAEHKLIKRIKAGMVYQFIYLNDLENEDLQPRHRLKGYLQGKYKIKRFAISLRELCQITFKDETERTYKMNPKWRWRNKIKVTYDIKHSPVSPFAIFESYYQLNNPDGNKFDKLRYSVGARYKLNKHHAIKIFGVDDCEINVKNPVNRWVLGATYEYSL